MLVDIALPTDQTEGTESVVATWFKQVGDPVTANEPLLEISTDKVSVEIPAPATGVLREILKNEGDEVAPGDIVGRIAESAAEPTASRESRGAERVPPPSPEPVGTGSIPAAAPELSPAVRRLLKEHALDPAAIQGTGAGGRITVQDVEAHLARVGEPAGQPVRPATPSAGIPSRRVPHSAMRRSIADHMVRSVAAAPHVTSVFEADCSTIIEHRTLHRWDIERDGTNLTLTAYFVRAAVEAIHAVPEANARWHDDALEIWEDVNIGIATALRDGGLIVPVVRKAQDLDLASTAKAVQELVLKARSGGLDPRDVQQGTFTISNHGVSGSLVAAPIIINQPQSAILGVGKIQERPVVIGGQVTARPMAYVSLTIDHRVLDGYAANRFLSRFVEVLERWE